MQGAQHYLSKRLPAPHERNPRPWVKRHVRYNVKTAVGIPVHVACKYTAIGINSLNNSDMPEASCAFHSWLQYNDRWHMGSTRYYPSRSGSAIGPLKCIPNPRDPKAR